MTWKELSEENEWLRADVERLKKSLKEALAQEDKWRRRAGKRFVALHEIADSREDSNPLYLRKVALKAIEHTTGDDTPPMTAANSVRRPFRYDWPDAASSIGECGK